jgi:hypothetical protein
MGFYLLMKSIITVSMVYDVTERKVFWCEQRKWNDVQVKSFHSLEEQ